MHTATIGQNRLRIQAALAPESGARFRLETLELAEPGPDEIIVRVAACGVCQTDVHARDDYFGIPFPAVFGHEGAGIVERVGAAVERVVRGDRVVMVSPACGTCPACARKLPGYCASARRIKFSGRLRDGRIPLTRAGEPVSGAFFQQSSFATHALATEGNVVKLPSDLPFEVAAALACGVNTGAGAVLNALRPEPGSAFAVFGAGAVGLAGLMAARIAGCTTLIVVERHENRLALARELGATDCIHAGTEDPVVRIKEVTEGKGVQYTLEAAGDPRALRQAVNVLAPLGVCCLVGSARAGVEAALEMAALQHGRTVRGCIQGDAPPQEFFPHLFAHYRAGRLPVERLIRHYGFRDINEALDDSVSGRTVKAVLRM
jgi:aryl-alcohol dehydrogenase